MGVPSEDELGRGGIFDRLERASAHEAILTHRLMVRRLRRERPSVSTILRHAYELRQRPIEAIWTRLAGQASLGT
jgi:hypothetical protein